MISDSSATICQFDCDLYEVQSFLVVQCVLERQRMDAMAERMEYYLVLYKSYMYSVPFYIFRQVLVLLHVAVANLLATPVLEYVLLLQVKHRYSPKRGVLLTFFGKK